VELALLAGVLASAGVAPGYAFDVDSCVRSVLDLLQQRFGITTAQAITREMWEAWGRDTDHMRTLITRLRKYAAAVNHHLGDYRERLSREDLARIGHLLLPPLPKQFRYRYVPEAEQRAAAQRQRKAKTDVVSECATAILALMLARYPSMDRFIHWYRQQLEHIEAGRLSIPARLVYEDDQLDLPRQPGPDAASVEDLQWRTSRVRLDLTICGRMNSASDGSLIGSSGRSLERRSASGHSRLVRVGRVVRGRVCMRTRTPTSSRCSPRTRCRGSWVPSLNGTRDLATRDTAAFRLTAALA